MVGKAGDPGGEGLPPLVVQARHDRVDRRTVLRRRHETIGQDIGTRTTRCRSLLAARHKNHSKPDQAGDP